MSLPCSIKIGYTSLSPMLLLSVLAAVFGNFQVGYHSGNMNAPQQVIENFFNTTWQANYNVSLTTSQMTILWAVTVSSKDFGGIVGALGVKGLADTFGRLNAGPVKSISVLVWLSCYLTLTPKQVMSLEEVLGNAQFWPLMLSLSVIPAVLQYLTLPFCPESPRYLLINRGQEEEAEAALRKLWGNSWDILTEINKMREEASQTQSKVTLRDFLSLRRYLNPISIIVAITLGAQLSGFNAILNYSTDIFTKAGFSQSQFLTLGTGVINVVFTVVSVLLVERVGRRKLLLTGFMVGALCNILLTVSEATMRCIPGMSYLQVLLVFSSISAYELGPGPISWFIAAELFDQSARPFGMAFTCMLNWGGKFLCSLLYPPLLNLMGAYVYLIFTAALCCAFTFTFFQLPETKGRTFDEIASEFRQANRVVLLKELQKDFRTFN
ncbi:Solute carrier family 2, facilitated glucose transporter member 1 [Acipenser ruthenus]|uniref:Solute carrier family 2, facilitated glucose transporter member 1 n=1 Tax=Acipenser ruthenus TaxID=7906 RepID=A0A662YR32_ACIRT|nr:Solute carrier family 2, facilitated glucose transporter member 1 [Acipenser ruthenus]